MANWYPFKRANTGGDPIIYVDISRVIYVRQNYASGLAVLGFKSVEAATEVTRQEQEQETRNTSYDTFIQELALLDSVDDVMQVIGPNALLIKNITS